VAQECIETKDGLTVWEDHFYPEIVDPDTGAVLPDGEKGELVFTSLTKEALPMIRYRTRDLTRLLPPTARSMRRIEKITGRSDDMLIIRGVMFRRRSRLMSRNWLALHISSGHAPASGRDHRSRRRAPGTGQADGDAAEAIVEGQSLIGISEVDVSAPGGIRLGRQGEAGGDRRPKV
jgi:phenylacetate-CoA ligase